MKMKRFVTYLYECERGNKVKNVGFIRVKVKEQETQLEVYIRNFLRGNDSGTIYVFIHKEELRSVELGEIQISNGQCDRYLVLSNENIMGSGCKIDDIEGIGEVRKKQLLNKFKTIKNLRNATFDELKEILPYNVAENLIEILRHNTEINE